MQIFILPFWAACYEMETGETQTGEVVENASWEEMGCPLFDLSKTELNVSQHNQIW